LKLNITFTGITLLIASTKGFGYLKQEFVPGDFSTRLPIFTESITKGHCTTETCKYFYTPGIYSTCVRRSKQLTDCI